MEGMGKPLLIVEDDPEITSALMRGLGPQGYDVATENRVERALERLDQGPFACAIVDVMLGTDSGLSMVRMARARGLTVPILMLSALSDVEDRTAGLEAGADDYVVKPFSFDELVARLRVQESRAQTRHPAAATLCPHARELRRGADAVTLTEREFDLLRLLIDTADVPRSRHTLFDALWASDGSASDGSASENVVDVYIGYLRRKLSGTDFGFEIRTIRSKGFCIVGPAPRMARC
jgi:DNA-binding response OmpR family regulator